MTDERSNGSTRMEVGMIEQKLIRGIWVGDTVVVRSKQELDDVIAQRKAKGLPYWAPKTHLPQYGNTFPQIVTFDTTKFDNMEYQGVYELAKALGKILKKYQKTYENLRFKVVHDCGCYNECNCSPSFIVIGDRMETPEEAEVREHYEQVKAHAAAQRMRADLERLKKVLGEE